MPILNYDRIQETSTSTGTGDFILSGAVSGGYDSFSTVYSVGDKMHYLIIDASGTEWETGIGTYSAADTLTRTTIKTNSSRNTSAINFSAGTKYVLCAPLAEVFPWAGATGDIWYRDSNGEMQNLAIGTSTQVLTISSGLPSWKSPALYIDTPSDPTGTSSVTPVMMGLAIPFTPIKSGIFQVVVTGGLDLPSFSLAVLVNIRYGTGSAPSNGAAETGTATSAAVQFNSTTATSTNYCELSLYSLISATIGTTYWVDLSVQSDGAIASPQGLTVSIIEL